MQLQHIWEPYFSLATIQSVQDFESQSFNIVVFVSSISSKYITTKKNRRILLLELFLWDEGDNTFTFKIFGDEAEYYQKIIKTREFLLLYNCKMTKFRIQMYGCMDRESAIHILTYDSVNIFEEVTCFNCLYSRLRHLLNYFKCTHPLLLGNIASM